MFCVRLDHENRLGGMTRPIFATLLLACTLGAVPPTPHSGDGAQTPAPAADKALFDGKTTAGWRGFGQKILPEGWKVVDGALTRVGKGGDIVSEGEYENFELTVEWKIAPG